MTTENRCEHGAPACQECVDPERHKALELGDLGAILGGDLAKLIASNFDDGDAAEDVRRARHTEARAVRDRLPQFVRAAKPIEMQQRIGSSALLDVAKRWSWGDGNVLLCGPTRSGKTTAAAYLFRRLLQRAVDVGGNDWENARWMRWASAEDLSVTRRNHGLGQGDPPEVIEACNARLLFLDDAGWDKDITEVCSVLAARYERGVPTVITTGHPRAALIAHYGSAVVRRMIEAGGKRSTVVDNFAQ